MVAGVVVVVSSFRVWYDESGVEWVNFWAVLAALLLLLLSLL